MRKTTPNNSALISKLGWRFFLNLPVVGSLSSLLNMSKMLISEMYHHLYLALGSRKVCSKPNLSLKRALVPRSTMELPQKFGKMHGSLKYKATDLNHYLLLSH